LTELTARILRLFCVLSCSVLRADAVSRQHNFCRKCLCCRAFFIFANLESRCYQESALALGEAARLTTKENRPRKSSQAAGSCHKVIGRANTRKPGKPGKHRDHQSADVSRRIGDPRNQVPSSPRRHNALICLPSRRGGGRMADRWFAFKHDLFLLRLGDVRARAVATRVSVRSWRFPGGSRLERREKSETFGRTLCAVSVRSGALWRGWQDVL